MDHPRVARLMDVYETEGRLSLVMECMEGQNLGSSLTTHRLKVLKMVQRQKGPIEYIPKSSVFTPHPRTSRPQGGELFTRVMDREVRGWVMTVMD